MGIMGSFINKTIVFFVCLFLLSRCFPSFRPQKKVRCRINVKNGTFVLVDYVGTLDRDFPSEVYFVRDKDSVLVHKGYRTKNMSVKDNTLIIYLKGEVLYHRCKINDYSIMTSLYN